MCFEEFNLFLCALPAQNLVSVRETAEFFNRHIMALGVHIPGRILLGHCSEQFNGFFLVVQIFAVLIRQVQKAALYGFQYLIKAFMDGLFSNEESALITRE